MGYWENTGYINSKSVEDVINEVSAMFSNERMALVPAPEMRERERYEPMQYANALEINRVREQLFLILKFNALWHGFFSKERR